MTTKSVYEQLEERKSHKLSVKKLVRDIAMFMLGISFGGMIPGAVYLTSPIGVHINIPLIQGISFGILVGVVFVYISHSTDIWYEESW